MDEEGELRSLSREDNEGSILSEEVQETPDQKLEETIKLADKALAQKHREKNTIRKTNGETYEIYPILTTSIKVLGEYGAGLELYFMFIKKLGFLFLFLSLLSIWSIYDNNSGNGLVEGAGKQW